jgi:integrase
MVKEASNAVPSGPVEITLEIVRTLPATGERYAVRDTKCRGLVLRVGASGDRSWVYDYRDAEGARQTYRVGNALDIRPADARKLVDKVRGTDPAKAKRDSRQAKALAESRTLRALLDLKEGRYWRDVLKSKRSGAGTRDRILSTWAPFIDEDIASLEVGAIDKHRAQRLATGLKPQTVNRDRTALLACLNQAAKWNLIERNPLKGSEPLKTDDDKRVRWLGQFDEHEEIKDDAGNVIGERARFLRAMDDHSTPGYLRQLAILAGNTGLRRGELFKLQWSAVNLAQRRITVTAATAKSAEQRHVGLNTSALAVLQELAKVRHISGYVFINADTGKPFTTVKKAWATLTKRAQLTDFRFHDLRHDFASGLVQQGVSLYEVKDRLGHSSITLTERYAHLAPNENTLELLVAGWTR